MGKKKEIPKYDFPIIETHCHLDYLKENNILENVNKSHQQGVEKIVTISVEPNNLKTVREISTNFESVYCSQGIHPHEAKQWDEAVKNEIESHINDKKVIAVGEIGLDFHYNNSPKEKQIEVFKTQMQIATDHNKPVIIHSRDADEETIEVLDQYKNQGVIHSFTSGIELAKHAIAKGYYLGFNGIITFKNAENVREALKICPIERVLIETDAPFLTPVPFRGKENAPFYIPLVAQKIAEVKEININEVLKICYQNSIDLFKFTD